MNNIHIQLETIKQSFPTFSYRTIASTILKNDDLRSLIRNTVIIADLYQHKLSQYYFHFFCLFYSLLNGFITRWTIAKKESFRNYPSNR